MTTGVPNIVFLDAKLIFPNTAREPVADSLPQRDNETHLAANITFQLVIKIGEKEKQCRKQLNQLVFVNATYVEFRVAKALANTRVQGVVDSEEQRRKYEVRDSNLHLKLSKYCSSQQWVQVDQGSPITKLNIAYQNAHLSRQGAESFKVPIFRYLTKTPKTPVRHRATA